MVSIDSQPTMEETILVGDDLMMGPPSSVILQEITSHVLEGVELSYTFFYSCYVWCLVLQAELESFKMEYANVRLECNAANERANILASKVISLEEKALRLRSNELKLERQLENSHAEISSFKYVFFRSNYEICPFILQHLRS
ncbi:hypothetical protein ES288_D02G197200v1 [Gossypium darwinii]|uniref:DUF7803 domain-containing protein n=1 Tax=Gossypium darwinii TaxID=34276 RepID=A0A5D2DIS8_GOSDA|nr:hypothetical protein ES288_D02G197200v1 [Gossypium darwinii]